MGRETIEKPSIFYGILKFYVDLCFKAYYKDITVVNLEKVPFDEPIIFTPNHQNALTDALALLYAIKRRQPVFLARSDIFNNPISNKILTFLKILPIYRIRDGISSLQNNNAIFSKTVDVLNSTSALVILPEGNHMGKRSLRSLKKGVGRIAFQAEEASGFSLGIKVIPVGIDYTNYVNIHSELYVCFGEALSVSDFYPEYKENKQKAIGALRQRLALSMKEVMIDIEDEDYYGTIDELRYICNQAVRQQLSLDENKKGIIDAQKTIIKTFSGKSDEAKEDLRWQVGKYINMRKDLKMREWIFERSHKSIVTILVQGLLIVVGFPVFFVGWLNNMIPYYLPVMATRYIKDKQFHSSIKFVFSLLVFPIFYILQFFVFYLTLKNLGYSFIYLIALPFLGKFSLEYYVFFKKWKASVKFRFLSSKKNKKLQDLLALRKSIHEIMLGG